MKAYVICGCVCVLLAVCSAFASAPEIRNLTIRQDGSRRVTVSYRLAGEPGIVTAEFLTNGVPIGAGRCLNVEGEVNCYVSGLDELHAFSWQPTDDGALPNVKIPLSEGGLSCRVTAWATNAAPPYMVVDLQRAKTVRFYATEDAVPRGIGDDSYKLHKLLLRKIPAANVTWRMGASTSDDFRISTVNAELHLVRLTRDYYMGVYLVTQQQFMDIEGSRRGTGSEQGEVSLKFPANQMTYGILRGLTTDGIDWPNTGRGVFKAGAWLDKLCRHAGLASFDLPTESEWEYACRAGSCSLYLNDMEGLYFEEGAYAWSKDLCQQVIDKTVTIPGAVAYLGIQPVGLLPPNGWGLYDMLGNGRELTQDKIGSEGRRHYPTGVVSVDPVGPVVGPNRVTRGGAAPDSQDRGQNYIPWFSLTGENDAWGHNVFRVWCAGDLNFDE